MKLKELIHTQVGFLKINDIFYCEGNTYKILSLGNRDINNVRCKNLKTNKIK